MVWPLEDANKNLLILKNIADGITKPNLLQEIEYDANLNHLLS